LVSNYVVKNYEIAKLVVDGYSTIKNNF
jgi:hypothetical protein